MFHRDAMKELKFRADGSLKQWEYVKEIETDAKGLVVRLTVTRVTETERGQHNTPYYRYQEHEYTSRAWITKIMRQYAHLAAKALTRPLL